MNSVVQKEYQHTYFTIVCINIGTKVNFLKLIHFLGGNFEKKNENKING